MKFGGTSVKDAEAIQNSSKIAVLPFLVVDQCGNAKSAVSLTFNVIFNKFQAKFINLL